MYSIYCVRVYIFFFWSSWLIAERNRLLYKQTHDTSPQFSTYCYSHSECTWHHRHKMTAPEWLQFRTRGGKENMLSIRLSHQWSPTIDAHTKPKRETPFSSMLQIMTALTSSLARDAWSLQSSPGGCAASTGALLSTETLRTENQASSPQSQCSDAGSVTPHLSSLPVSPYSLSAASPSDVSAT